MDHPLRNVSIYFHLNFTPLFPDLTELFASGVFSTFAYLEGYTCLVRYSLIHHTKTSFGCLLTKKHLPFYWQVLMLTNLCLLFSKPFHSLFKACSVERNAPLGGVFQNGSQLVRAFSKEILN